MKKDGQPIDVLAIATMALNAAVNMATRVVSIAILVLIVGAVAGHYGIRSPVLPKIDATALAWLAGAWWLYRGGKL